MPRYFTVCLCLGLVLSGTAAAMNGPTAISIDGGPLGNLSLSGGAAGDGYVLDNAIPGEKTTGITLGNALIQVQKTTGIVQFTVAVGAYSSETLGYAPAATNYVAESPLYAGYVTIAPNADISISAGQLSPLVGYEASQDWSNANTYFSEVAYTEPAQGRGVEVALTQGNFSATVSLTDGYYTNVLNYVQGIGTYAADANDSVSLFGGGNLGRTGVNVPGIGNQVLDNSTLLGAFYTRTQGALSLTPEVQVQYAAKDAARGQNGGNSAVTVALFGDEQLGQNSPQGSAWSVGGFVEYATQFYDKSAAYAYSPDFFGFGPGSSLYGVSITPTWQHQDLFLRADAGYIHVHRGSGATAFGTNGDAANQVSGLLEAGVVF